MAVAVGVSFAEEGLAPGPGTTGRSVSVAKGSVS
jgi:hypothetical protein